MARGPNRVPGRCEVPPSNGAPTITTSAPRRASASARSARSTPRKVMSGPYIDGITVSSVRPPAVGGSLDYIAADGACQEPLDGPEHVDVVLGVDEAVALVVLEQVFHVGAAGSEGGDDRVG